MDGNGGRNWLYGAWPANCSSDWCGCEHQSCSTCRAVRRRGGAAAHWMAQDARHLTAGDIPNPKL